METNTEIRVSIESGPWRRKFSRPSCRDSNPQPFSHESGALTTELSPPRWVGGGEFRAGGRGLKEGPGDGLLHTASTAFRHLPPNSARFSYATEGALFISVQLSTDAVSALRKVRVLIRLWKQPSAKART